jgi:uncharacterized repeat protein (TIGR02543 family)
VGTANLPSEPTRTNYTFGGWYTERNGGGAQFYVDTEVTGNITVYAKWTVIQYTVTFDADGGSPTGEQKTVDSGAWVGTPNMPPDPAKPGYIFGGWYREENGGGDQFYVDTKVTASITVYAMWTPDSSIQYTVTFDADGGSPVSPPTRMVPNGSSTGSSMPANPTKGGSVFGGWYTGQSGGGTKFTAGTTVTGNITVYALWTTQHTVTFDADGGSPTPPPQTVLDGNSVGVPNIPSNPSRTHYTFDGWYTGQNGGGTKFDGETQVNSDITVYAKWTNIPYTVTFNVNDGSGAAPQTRTVNSESSVGSSNMPPDPVRTGYTFGDWFTEPNGGGTKFTASTPVTGNRTVYAKWTLTPVPPGLSLNDSLAWLSDNAVEGGAYTITLANNETILPQSLSYSGKTVGITLSGGTTERTINLSSTGSLFTVESGVTLTLGSNVTLQGRSDNTASLVRVNSGGMLVMNAGSKVIGNTVSYSYFYTYGGGIYVTGGTFTMNGGTISGNTTTTSSPYSAYGGGVAVTSGIFTMNGGTISGNTARNYGGGVYVSGGTFTKSGGTIYGSNTSSTLQNTAGNDSYGHAVYVNISPAKKRSTTASTGVTLDSTKGGTAGGWE